jgi:hypothetical protein
VLASTTEDCHLPVIHGDELRRLEREWEKQHTHPFVRMQRQLTELFVLIWVGFVCAGLASGYIAWKRLTPAGDWGGSVVAALSGLIALYLARWLWVYSEEWEKFKESHVPPVPNFATPVPPDRRRRRRRKPEANQDPDPPLQ